MTETLSLTTRLHFELSISSWLRSFERELREIAPLTPEETEVFLQGIYGESYAAMRQLQAAKLMPASTLANEVRLSWPSCIHGQGTVVLLIVASEPLPAFNQYANNVLWLRNSDGETEQMNAILPPRFQQSIQDLTRVREALTDLHHRLDEYTRVRWLLNQWPNALRFFPKHVRASLQARAFKRPPPKHATTLKPETLQTLAWLSLLYPLPEQ